MTNLETVGNAKVDNWVASLEGNQLDKAKFCWSSKFKTYANFTG